VRTYGWIARAIGKPGAARAVGTALAKNPFAPTIPCHRVVRSDGGSGGYSAKGGLKKKVLLLKKEGWLPSPLTTFTPSSLILLPKGRRKQRITNHTSPLLIEERGRG
jgi:O-6-methylguanine DNA methyltransferase